MVPAQVKDVAENPLAKQSMAARGDASSSNMETRLLENSINKICSLLAIGFGDAGGQVRRRPHDCLPDLNLPVLSGSSSTFHGH